MTSTVRTSLDRFIQNKNLTMRVERTNRNPYTDDTDWHGARHFKCIIERHNDHDLAGGFGPRSQFVTFFSQGSAHTNDPTIADVLDCLASDSAGYENARSFEEWCGEYGYDTDSRRAERIYNTIAEQSKQLRHFLGDAAFQSLLFKIERL